jgi:hypothetical protein
MKIVELLIDDEFEESGIEAISLVSTPAHEESWIAFNSEEQPEVDNSITYRIVEDDFCANNPLLDSLGEPYDALINEGWVLTKVEQMTPDRILKMSREKFSDPNAESQEDTVQFRIRFKYVGPRDNKNRQFCADMLSKNRVYRIEDIEQLSNPEFGNYDIFTWRGSFNCRHTWVKLIYTAEGKIRNSGSSTRGLEGEEPLSTRLQPDTRPGPTIRSADQGRGGDQWKEGMPRTGPNIFAAGEKVSIDYDDTLSTDRGMSLAKDLISKGIILYIISARQDKAPMLKRAAELNIPESRVYATGSNKSKIEKIKELGITKHHDNNKDVIDELGSIGQKFAGLEDACWEGYEAIGTKILDGKEVPNCVPIKMTEDDFAESIVDYPQGVKDAAERAVKWADENGWGSCGTQVGKTRASQLASGDPISVDTLKRMYSYLSRHKVDLESSKTYEDGCGKLMYDSWGGEAALTWSERKLKQLENEKMTFAVASEDKMIIVGAAMVPNKMIHRYDMFGNKYYVYFSKQSIRKMADRFLKQKRTDETSIEHNGIKLGSDKVYITESWISEDPIKDKSALYGFNLPAGTWFVMMKVDDPKVWELIKKNFLSGFSVEGLFREKAVFSKEKAKINQIKNY